MTCVYQYSELWCTYGSCCAGDVYGDAYALIVQTWYCFNPDGSFNSEKKVDDGCSTYMCGANWCQPG